MVSPTAPTDRVSLDAFGVGEAFTTQSTVSSGRLCLSVTETAAFLLVFQTSGSCSVNGVVWEGDTLRHAPLAASALRVARDRPFRAAPSKLGVPG